MSYLSLSYLHNYGLVRVLSISENCRTTLKAHFGVTEVIWYRVSTRTLVHACTLKALFKVAVELKITAVLCYCQNVCFGNWHVEISPMGNCLVLLFQNMIQVWY